MSVIDEQSPTRLTLQASLIMLNKSFLTRESVNKQILEKEKEIEEKKDELIKKENELINLKSITDEDLVAFIKRYDKRINEILDILDKQNSEDASNQALIIRSLRDKAESEKT